jgi:hypothetical protein
LLINFPTCLAFFNSKIETQSNYLESCRDIERGEKGERPEREERESDKENNDDRERVERAIEL